ncbi:MAG: OmpA family protein [Deltaproteobacteria bacterium]|nr:OmpA family protein [Deltaproteobacteria bacterium]
MRALALLSLVSTAALAQAPLRADRGGPGGYGSERVRPSDDAAASVSLAPLFPAGMCLFGAVNDRAFISTNGTVSLGAAVPAFTQMPFPVAAHPLIAPLWTDVDTRAGSANPADNAVWFDVDDEALLVTWSRVQRSGDTETANTVQLEISNVRGPGDYDVVFRYASIEWLGGRASDGLLGTPAQVGFDAGDGQRFVDVALTRSPALFALPGLSNHGAPGELRFHVRDCALPVCGDRVVDDGEPCDDGNRAGDDGCSSLCALEPAEVIEIEDPDVVVREDELVIDVVDVDVDVDVTDPDLVVREEDITAPVDDVGHGVRSPPSASAATDVVTDGRSLGGGGLVGSCQSVDGSSAAGLLLGVLLLRRRRRLPSALLLALAVAPAAVAAPAVSLERFRPGLDAQSILDVESGSVGEHLHANVAMWIGAELNPLVIHDGATREAVIAGRVHGNLSAALSLFDWLQIGIDQPVVLVQGNNLVDDAEAFRSTGSGFVGGGDLRISPKLRLLRSKDAGVDVAVVGAFSIPTFSAPGSWVSERAVLFTPELVSSTTIGPLRLAVNAGYRFREERQVLDLVVGSEVLARAGASLMLRELVGLPVEVSTTLSGAASTRALGAVTKAGLNETPVEALAGISFEPLPNIAISAYGGVGLIGGWGTPDARIGLAVRFGGGPSDDDDDDAPVAAEPRPVTVEPTPSPVEDVAVPAVEPVVRIESQRIVIDDVIHFPLGYAWIEARSAPLLDEIARVLLAHPEIKGVTIEGHTDGVGSKEVNLWLSKARAEAVLAALVARGVPAELLHVVAWGPELPIADNVTRDGRQLNRRVELSLQF